jgi:hypothetical protein
MAHNIQASGVVAARLLDPENELPALYGLSQPLMRWYEVHATNTGIDDADQTRLEIWQYVESDDGRTPHFQGGTKESYSDINLVLKTFLRATKKL